MSKKYTVVSPIRLDGEEHVIGSALSLSAKQAADFGTSLVLTDELDKPEEETTSDAEQGLAEKLEVAVAAGIETQAKLETVEAANADLTEKVTATNAKYDALKSDYKDFIAKKKSEIDELNSKLKVATGEIAGLKKPVEKPVEKPSKGESKAAK